MARRAFDGFSIELPAGWRVAEDDATFSDPEQPPPVTFAHDAGGALQVQPLFYQEHDQPGHDLADAEELAHAWGVQRGFDKPLAASSHARDDGALANARFRLGGDHIEIWFLTSGDAVLHASFVCPWADREGRRADLDALVASLRFA